MKKPRALPVSTLALALIVFVASGLVIREYRQEQANHKLIRAIKANDANGVLYALDIHADPNTRDHGDATPSLRVYLSHLWQRMRGIKPTVPDREPTALRLAVQEDNTSVVAALLAAGGRNRGERVQVPDEDRAGPSSLTLPMIAARNKNLALVRMLLQHGWDVNEANGSQETVLFFADDPAIIKMLVARGVKINAKDEFGWTALDYGLRNASNDGVDMLLALKAYDTKALKLAIIFDQTAALKKMVSLGWKLEGFDEDGQTPLTSALYSSHGLQADAALILIRGGAQVNQTDKDGALPLLLAAAGGRYPEMDTQSPEIIEALLAHGAEIDRPNGDGFTPLMVAAFHLRPVLVRQLLRHGAKVNRRSETGDTALRMAQTSPYSQTRRGCQPVVLRLLRKARAKDGGVRSPLQ